MELRTPERHLEATGVVATKGFSVKMDAHMMHLLSGLYADIPWAVVREYWSNGEDGHDALVRRGLQPPRPIEIHVPNSLEPWFEVKDYGIGMDHETVFEIYTQYGNSTKSNNNQDIGGFGIGAKAAFCYDIADHWTVESRFNGEIRSYVASKDAASMPTLVLLSEGRTTEPTGISVRIPVLPKDIPVFRAAISRFAKRRKHAFVILGDTNGVQAGSYDPIKYVNQTAEFGWRSSGSGEHGVQAIMGGVPYPIDLTKNELNISSKERTFLGKQGSVDFFFDIGDLDITPSREALMYTPRTIKVLKDKFPALFGSTVTSFMDGLAKCQTHWDAVRYIAANEESYDIARSPLGGNKQIQFKGKAISASSHMEIELDDIIKAHAKAPTGVKVAVFSKYYGQFDRLKDVVPFSALPMVAGQVQAAGMRTALTLTAESLRSSFPIVVVADCPAALSLMKEYWKDSSVTYTNRTELYLIQGKGLDAAVIQATLEGYPVHSANTLTQAIQNRRATTGTTTLSKKPASLHVWEQGYFTKGEVDLTVGGYYIPMFDGHFEEESLRDFTTRHFNNSHLDSLIRSLIILGHMHKDDMLVGVPKTRMKKVEGLPQWKNFWRVFKSVVNKEINKGIPQNAVRGEEIIREMDSLEYLQLMKVLKTQIPKGPLASLKAAADKRRAAIQAYASELDKFNAISTLRQIMTGSTAGKTRKTNPKGVDISDLKSYNTWLGLRYPMIDVIRKNTWGFDRVLLNTQVVSSIVNYIEMVDANVPVQNAPKLS